MHHHSCGIHSSGTMGALRRGQKPQRANSSIHSLASVNAEVKPPAFRVRQPYRVILRAVMPTLILLRHGESTWNQENRFTGWHDVPLSELGRDEARKAGHLLADAGVTIDVVQTSLLRR